MPRFAANVGGELHGNPLLTALLDGNRSWRHRGDAFHLGRLAARAQLRQEQHELAPGWFAEIALHDLLLFERRQRVAIRARIDDALRAVTCRRQLAQELAAVAVGKLPIT